MIHGNDTLKERGRKGFPGERGGILARILLALFLLALASAALAGGFFYYIVQGLPSISSLKDYRPSIITRVYGEGN
ncbi:MAG TPA: hypothetical protein PKL99_03385, partial [Syntrophales bacterium]|nr:hypothetical protein [Syntrophales bacterium]